jgi:NADH-quinone oxidoreductase subunit A
LNWIAMPAHLNPYVPVIIASLVIMGGVVSLFVANHMLGPRRPNPSKGLPFECGNPPTGSSRRRISVKYYVVAILFLVFDVEAVFLFPWAAQFRTFMADDALALTALLEMFLFLGVLALGLAYVWKRGALKWE